MEKEAKLRLGRKEVEVGGSRKRKRTQKARRNRGEYTCLYPVERYTSQDREWRGEVEVDETFLRSFIKARETFSSPYPSRGFIKFIKWTACR